MRVISAIAVLTVVGGISSGLAADHRRVDGYGPWRFGMTLDQAKRVDQASEKTECEYEGVAFCLERNGDIMGEKARISALFSLGGETLFHINVTFSRLEGGTPCKTVLKKMIKPLVDRYGKAPKIEGRNAVWYAEGGGKVSLINLCLTDDKGVVVVSYEPADGL